VHHPDSHHQPQPPTAAVGRVTLILAVACLAASGGCGGLSRSDNAAGVQLYQQGNYLGAVNHFQQALAKQPGNADCFYNLGATYHQQAKLLGRPADLQTAEQYYHLCLARNPNHEACQRGLAVLLVEENRRDEALAQLQQWGARQPGNPNPQIEIARLCEEHGDVREAENHLIDALAIDPNNPRALVALGQLREASGQSSQALANYTRALAVDPGQSAVAARAATLSAAQPTAARMAALPALPPPPPVIVPPSAATGNAYR
jgi:tetratricopeptide (TPR) repeat protein